MFDLLTIAAVSIGLDMFFTISLATFYLPPYRVAVLRVMNWGLKVNPYPDQCIFSIKVSYLKLQ